MIARRRIDARGRTRVPKDLREALGLLKGTTVEWVQDGDVLHVRKLDSGASVFRRYMGIHDSIDDVDAYIAEMRGDVDDGL